MAKRKTLSKTALKRLRGALDAERAEVIQQAADLDTAADVKQWRDSGFDDDFADTGSANFERDRAASLANHARRLLTQIDDALQRMDDDAYGTCARCGQLIELARLEAVPYATLCLEDKQREEHGR